MEAGIDPGTLGALKADPAVEAVGLLKSFGSLRAVDGNPELSVGDAIDRALDLAVPAAVAVVLVLLGSVTIKREVA